MEERWSLRHRRDEGLRVVPPLRPVSRPGLVISCSMATGGIPGSLSNGSNAISDSSLLSPFCDPSSTTNGTSQGLTDYGLQVREQLAGARALAPAIPRWR